MKQLRAGYEMDLEDTLDDSLTAGIGISPFDVVSLDLAGSYAGENQFGASLNLAFKITFRNSKQTYNGIPIMASNMDTVGTFEMAKTLAKVIIPKCIAMTLSI